MADDSTFEQRLSAKMADPSRATCASTPKPTIPEACPKCGFVNRFGSTFVVKYNKKTNRIRIKCWRCDGVSYCTPGDYWSSLPWSSPPQEIRPSKLGRASVYMLRKTWGIAWKAGLAVGIFKAWRMGYLDGVWQWLILR